MEINLEKIELVKERTGATYAESKEALERTDGNVVDAIIDIEEKMSKKIAEPDEAVLNDNPIFAKIKKIITKGNVNRIVVSKNGTTYVNFPLTASVLGLALVPWSVILGIIAALGTQCDIQFVDDQDQVIDLNGKVVSAYDKAKGSAKKGINKMHDFVDKIDNDGETIDKLGDYANKATDKIQQLVEEGVAAFNKTFDKINDDGKIDVIKDSVEKAAKDAFEVFKQAAKQAAEKADDFKDQAEEKVDDVEDKVEVKIEELDFDVDVDDQDK